MKKFILAICASMICNFMSYAQQIQDVGVDGIKLGMKVSDAVFYIGRQGDFKLTNKGSNWYEYENTAGTVYTLYFYGNDIVNRIYKSERGAVQTAMENLFNSDYADILYKYGEPMLKSNSSLVWRDSKYKIVLEFGMYNNGYINVYYVTQTYEAVE